MTIEIADKLVKLRKKNGYSQEELADKLGLSRQAVSKWERAEASPDTDNLICLAKLYNVSLDELLSTEDDVDTIVKEQVKEKKEGITLTDDEGNSVEISNKGIKHIDPNGNEVKHKPDQFIKILTIIESSLSVVALITYILLGVFLDMWYNGWVFLFIPEIICSFFRAVHKKNANDVNVTFIAIFTYFFVCMVAPGLSTPLWHPMWVVFLIIPLYHSLAGGINKALGKEDKDE